MLLLFVKLQEKQRDLAISDRQLAQYLGVSLSLLRQVKGGTRNPGVKFLSGLVKAFPDLILPVLEYLSKNGDSK